MEENRLEMTVWYVLLKCQTITGTGTQKKNSYQALPMTELQPRGSNAFEGIEQKL